MKKRQSVANLCSDDIVRNPETGRLVRLMESSGEKGEKFTGFSARDLETSELVILVLRNTVTVKVYID